MRILLVLWNHHDLKLFTLCEPHNLWVISENPCPFFIISHRKIPYLRLFSVFLELRPVTNIRDQQDMDEESLKFWKYCLLIDNPSRLYPVISQHNHQIVSERHRTRTLKDATQVNFSQKTALYVLREAILTTRHLFGSKNEVSKLFEKINFILRLCIKFEYRWP